jgi:hypothetical protein
MYEMHPALSLKTGCDNLIQEQSATLQDTNQSHRSDQSPQINSSVLGLVRGSLVFLVALVCLAWLSFLSHFLLSSAL